MTKEEFQELQVRAASSGITLKEFLRREGIAYSTYNYWNRKVKAEANPLPIAPIKIQNENRMEADPMPMTGVELPGVTVAFPNGVKAHFGRGSERMLMEVLTQSMS